MRSKVVSFLLIIFCSISVVYAQGVKIDKEELLNIPLAQLLDLHVIGASGFMELKSDAPATMVVITEDQIQDRGYYDLSDILKDIPGIDIVDNARGYGEYYTLKGIEGNDRFLVMIDGKKINPPSGTFLSIGNSISVSFAHQVEVIFGPASVIYGADAYSGIINIITKPASEKISLNARYGLGSSFSNDLNIETSGQINDDLSFFASARIFTSKGPDFRGKDTIFSIIDSYHSPQRPEFEQPINDHTLYLRTRYKDFSLSYFRQGFDEGNALGVHPNGFIYNKENKWKVSNNIWSLDYKKEFNEHTSLSFDINGIYSSIDPSTQWYKWFGIYNIDSAVSQYMTGRDNSLRSSLNFTHRINEELKFQTGLEIESTRSIPPYANNQVLNTSVKFDGEDARIIIDELSLTEHRLAGLAQFTYQPSPIIQFILGGRYDFSTRYKGVFNPRSGLILEPTKRTRIKILYGTAFQAPSLFLLYEQFGDPWLVMYSSDDYRSLVPDWTLQPQKIHTGEILIHQEITDNLEVNCNLYHSNLTNLISRVVFSDSVYNKFYSTPEKPLFSTGIVNTNIGTQTINGAIFNVIGRAKNLSFEASYSYTNAYSDIDGTHFPVSRVAKHKLLGTLTWTNTYLSLSPRIRVIGKINNENKDAYPDGLQPGYTQIDINIRSKEFFKTLRFYGSFNNVLNSHIEHGGLHKQDFGYLPAIIQDGFNFRLGVQIQIAKSSGVQGK